MLGFAELVAPCVGVGVALVTRCQSVPGASSVGREQGVALQQTERRRQGNGLKKDEEGTDVEGKGAEGEDQSRDVDKERDSDAEVEEVIRDAKKGKDGDADAEEESRESKEQKEGSGRETTTTEDIGVRQQGTPHWNAHQDD
ncbi:hypothetical protein NDU88_003922 [Pleurodeles waltl]|uniref:Uncharacterized protein n=1 Tax=Pleurodeles waltl TaxID=8319 RepID=A0AAV7W7H9_PLEWA|nr:hypothetical protein NDU88_003922 [Pleurodeles waltl]